MFQTKSKKLYKEFEELLNQGNEKDLELFLRDNLKKFPEKVQNKITVVLLKRTLEKVIEEDNNSIRRFQENGITTLKKLEKMKLYLKDREDELLAKESLNN
jgi:hypothetical protein